MNALKPNKMNANSETTTRIIGFSGNKAWLMVKLCVNPFESFPDTVHVKRDPFPDKDIGDMVTIPAGWRTEVKRDKEGVTFKFKDGVEQRYLTYKPASETEA